MDEPQVRGAPRLRDAHWVKPRLVAQVRFTEWTHDGKLRHPSFQGLRPDKTPMETVRERPAATPKPPAKGRARSRSSSKSAAAAKTVTTAKSPTAPTAPAAAMTGRAQVAEVQLTNPTRLLYPKDGITKQDVATYYDAVSGPLLAAIRDRPLAVIHWNQGINKPGWFQQNTGQEAERHQCRAVDRLAQQLMHDQRQRDEQPGVERE